MDRQSQFEVDFGVEFLAGKTVSRTVSQFHELYGERWEADATRLAQTENSAWQRYYKDSTILIFNRG